MSLDLRVLDLDWSATLRLKLKIDVYEFLRRLS